MSCPYCNESDCCCADMHVDNSILEQEVIAERLSQGNSAALALYHSTPHKQIR